MKRLFRAASGDPETLIAILAQRLGLDEVAAAALLSRGAVEVDGRRAGLDGPVRIGAKVVAFLPDEAPPAQALVVAYRDEHVLVVDKPAGLRSQAVRGEAKDTLIARVQHELDDRATLLHRLDRETSGLLLLPVSSHGREFMQKAMDEGRIERRYIARVQGRVDAARDISLRIARDPQDPRRRLARGESESAGEAATTSVEPLEPGDETSLVQLRLETGRTHQLRVHLAAIGHPILGDQLYAGPPAERLCLHADELAFPHPRSGELRTVRSEPPQIITRT